MSVEEALRIDRETALLEGMIADPTTIPHAGQIVEPGELAVPINREVYRELRLAYREGRSLDPVAIAAALHQRGALPTGGPAYIAGLYDGAATGALVIDHAIAVRRFRLEENLTRLLEHGANGAGLDGIGSLEEQLQDLRRRHEEGAGKISLSQVGFTGARLEAVRERPATESPLPGLFDPSPHLHLNQGKQKTGKTTFALSLARSWCVGDSPWPGAPELPGSRVLIISKEQPVARIDSTLRRLSMFMPNPRREEWTERLTIVARDHELGPDGKSLLTLDSRGLATLRRGLASAKEDGEPYGLVILDSLSRLKPAGISENDTDEMTPWLDALEEIAIEFETYVVLIHHVGHTEASGRGEARSAARGSSAIGAVAQAAWLIERVPGCPQQRTLKVDGNELLTVEHRYSVCTEDADSGSIFYFRPWDAVDQYEIDDLLDEGETINVSNLARKLSDPPLESGQQPSGAARRNASDLMRAWERDNRGRITTGKRNAIEFERRAAPAAPG